MLFDSVAFLAFLLHSLLLCLPVSSIPLDARQADDLPQTLTSTTTGDSAMGPIVMTCEIIRTPAKDGDRDVIVEVKTCTLVVIGSRPSSSTEITSSTVLPSTTTATPPPESTSSSITSFSSTTEPTPFVTGAVEGTLPTVTSTTSITTPRPAGTLTSSISVQPSAAALSGISTTSDSSMPGKKLAVLPIGLGVFAGISVVALIVVGLVTYERTKYRKAFRQRKLAEIGAPMGYGGMNY